MVLEGDRGGFDGRGSPLQNDACVERTGMKAHVSILLRPAPIALPRRSLLRALAPRELRGGREGECKLDRDLEAWSRLRCQRKPTPTSSWVKSTQPSRRRRLVNPDDSLGDASRCLVKASTTADTNIVRLRGSTRGCVGIPVRVTSDHACRCLLGTSLPCQCESPPVGYRSSWRYPPGLRDQSSR